MAIRIGGTRKIFKKYMYKDRFEVYRLTQKENDDFTVNNQVLEPLYTNEPCKVSLNYQDLPEEDSLLVNPTNQHIGIFVIQTRYS